MFKACNFIKGSFTGARRYGLSCGSSAIWQRSHLLANYFESLPKPVRKICVDLFQGVLFCLLHPWVSPSVSIILFWLLQLLSRLNMWWATPLTLLFIVKAIFASLGLVPSYMNFSILLFMSIETFFGGFW